MIKTITNGFRYVSDRGKGRWAKNKYLSETKPKSTRASSSSGSRSGGGISGAPCPAGSSASSASSDAIRVHCALRHRYPQFTRLPRSPVFERLPRTGSCSDCMIFNTTVGWNAARWLRANAKSLGVMEVIDRQQIWTVQRSPDGWRPMSDRGSPTANQMTTYTFRSTATVAWPNLWGASTRSPDGIPGSPKVTSCSRVCRSL